MTGIPYMGSKRKLAPDLILHMANANPDARHFYDLFGGGGEFIRVVQPHGFSDIRIDTKEWPVIRDAIDRLFEECNK